MAINILNANSSVSRIHKNKIKLVEKFNAQAGLRNEKVFKQGQTIFNKSKGSEKHLKDLVKFLITNVDDPLTLVPKNAFWSAFIQKSLSLNLPKDKLIAHIIKERLTEAKAKAKEQASIAPEMFSAIEQNIVESTIFSIFSQSGLKIPKAPKLSGIILNRLFEAIQIENKQFFPLKDFVTLKSLRGMPNLITVPSPAHPKMNRLKTAGITKFGNIFLNKNFAQSLLDYAFIKNIKPKKRKYECNGGDIPDYYCYLEFVIMHEFMHFSYGDFYYDKIFNVSPLIINYSGDYRTNYKLVASGFEQLPIGLYSDTLNYDYYESYSDIVDKVKEEVQKLKDAGASEESDDNFDEHTDSDGEIRPDSSEDSDSQKENNNDKNSNEENEDSREEDSNDSKQNNKNNTKKESKASRLAKEKTVDDIDNKAREVDSNIDKGKDLDNKELEKEKDNAENEQLEKDKLMERLNKSEGLKKEELDISTLKPRFKWKTLLKRAVNKAEKDFEETYAKPSRGAATRIKQAVDSGMAVMKPGERLKESAKFAIVVDSSGSMTPVIRTVYSELTRLFKSSELSGDCLLYRFSDIYELFHINLKNKKAKQIHIKTGNKIADKPIQSVLYHLGAGTEFTTLLRKELEKRLVEGYNILIISDSDLLWTENRTNLLKLIRKKRQAVFVILDSKETFDMYVKHTNAIPANITHWS